jgi:hypothetical protein
MTDEKMRRRSDRTKSVRNKKICTGAPAVLSHKLISVTIEIRSANLCPAQSNLLDMLRIRI